MKKWPKLSLRWRLSKVLANTTIFSPLTFSVTILLFHEQDSNMLNIKIYRCIFHQKGYSVGETARETKPSPTPFFSHFTQLSPPPIAKWESLSSYLFPFLKVLFLSLQTMAFRAKVISRCIFQSHNAWLWNTVKPELQNHTAKNI